MPIFAEYIWIDGTKPSKQTRSKTRILPYDAVKHSGNPLGSALWIPAVGIRWIFDRSGVRKGL